MNIQVAAFTESEKSTNIDKLFGINTDLREYYNFVWFNYVDMVICIFYQWFVTIYMIYTVLFKYWTEHIVLQ